MKHLIIVGCLWLCCLYNVTAQKQLSRTYDASTLKSLQIDGDGAHQVVLQTSKTNEVSIQVQLEGETSDEIVIEETLKKHSLALRFSAWPYATQYNDKLSAHKIVSVLVQVKVPENLFVSITSATAKVHAEGNFEMLYVAIEDEPCILKHFRGNASLKTNRGAIRVEVASSLTAAKAKTTYGNVLNELPNAGEFMISTESIHGDITLLKTQ